MASRDKLLGQVCSNPKDVSFKDACKIAKWLGFTHMRGKGSHRVYAKSGELMQMNFQNRNGKILAYQARQLITMIEKYMCASVRVRVRVCVCVCVCW